MAAPVYIVDPKTGNKATVSEFGQLTVSPVDYSTSVQASMIDVNTVYNLVEPVDGKLIIITDLILTANKSVGTNDATVSLYTTNVKDSLIEKDKIIEIEMASRSNMVLTGLNLKVDAGLYINSKTNDNTVFVTLMYYRVPVD